MKLPLFILAALVAAPVLSLRAQSVDDLQIKERSAFALAPGARNPFLPIGWIKPQPAAPGAVAPVAIPEVSDAFFRPEAFVVTSISIGALPLALINGKAYGEGDLIPMGAGVNVQVFAIRDGQVTLRYRGKTIVTAIHGQTPSRQHAAPAHPAGQ